MKRRKFLRGSILFSALLLLSGCVKTDRYGKPTGEGWVYHYLLQPMNNLFDWLVHNWHIQYGWAIILITFVIRIVLMPIFINQIKNSSIQQEKMQYLKPYLEPLQEKMKTATTQEEKMAANLEIQKFYKDNGVNMLGMTLGCLPLLLQFPIFSALFMAVKHNPGILKEVFLGIDLSERSVVLLVITAGLYLLQSYISLIGLDKEQKEQMRFMTFSSPIMMVIFGFTMPAGVELYWVAGGIVMIIQQCIGNLIIKPRIKAQVAAEFKENPPKKPKTMPRKDVTNSTKQKSTYAKLNQGRNAGKQHHQDKKK